MASIGTLFQRGGFVEPTVTPELFPVAYTFVSSTLTLSWNAVAGATGYEVLVGTNPGSLQPIGDTFDLEFSVTGLAQTVVFFQVVARFGSRSSIANALTEAVSTPPPPALDCCDLDILDVTATVTGSNATATLDWSQPCKAFRVTVTGGGLDFNGATVTLTNANLPATQVARRPIIVLADTGSGAYYSVLLDDQGNTIYQNYYGLGYSPAGIVVHAVSIPAPAIGMVYPIVDRYQ